MRTRLAFLVLALSALACGEFIITPTPTVSPVPSALPIIVTVAPTATAPATVTAEAEQQTAVVRAAMVNVRAEPDGEIVGQLVAGTDVRVIECAADWCQIVTDELSGYVFQGCLSIADGRGCEAR